jgi:hypothetical protein
LVGARINTRMDVLIWHDLVQNSMKDGIFGTYLALLRTAWIYLSTGTLRRLSWLAKGPILAALYPVAMLLAQLCAAVFGSAMVASLAGFVLVRLFGGLATLVGAGTTGEVLAAIVGTSVFWVIFLPLIVVTMRWFKSFDHKTFAYYLMQDYAYTARRCGAYPEEIEARLHEWRHRIEAALREEIDEVLIVGHSSGAQLAVSLVADILRSQPGRGAGPALALLTLGQVIPMLSFLPDARRLRSDLRLLSGSDEIAWLDVSAPGDGCCFALSDPVAVSGVAPERGQIWPIIISAAFTKTLSPEMLQSLKRRYFRLHFQYLCAFDQPGDFDYFRVTAGPQTLQARFAGRRSSQNRIDVPASRYTSMSTVRP